MGSGRSRHHGNGGFRGFSETRCLADPYNMGGITCRPYAPDQFVGFGGPFLAPFIVYGADYQPAEEMATPPQPEPDNALAGQIARLADEVESLREERTEAPQPAPAAEEEPVLTALVYRDGHQAEIQNYAVLGGTLYVFSGQTARRIPLADLDLEATQRVNDERGVEFISPETP